MLTFAVPAQLTSAPISPAPISSRCVRRNNEQRSFDRVASMLSVAMTAALARSKSRRKVMLFSSDRDADEAGGPVALVLRSKLQELAKTTSAQRAAKRWQELGNAKVLMPENSIPWGVTHFIGGAVLGQFPELCYSSLLQPFVDKTGMAVICTPYELSRDHQEIADVAASDFAEAFELGEERFGWAKDRMPRLAMGHSLGAKLQVLLSCQRPHPMLAGVALLAFNNFGVEDQVRLLREVLKTVQGSGGLGGLASEQLWENFLEPAIGRAAKLSGLQFTPGPDEVLDLVEESYKTDLRTRLFRFSNDSLDCSEELLSSFVMRGARKADSLEMKGGHLTPVVVSLADMAPEGASGVADRLKERFGGFGALGSEAELEDLVQALMDFVSGLR
ncbi:unnamed protein product [Durusdinium trenchii]|uniref:Uncharacterized protein n=1 Tax=Durusdinium trenchii TaxID=1381693 RepID=A0ABP0MRJ8_9DINO